MEEFNRRISIKASNNAQKGNENSFKFLLCIIHCLPELKLELKCKVSKTTSSVVVTVVSVVVSIVVVVVTVGYGVTKMK
jgi:hypothetical protein